MRNTSEYSNLHTRPLQNGHMNLHSPIRPHQGAIGLITLMALVSINAPSAWSQTVPNNAQPGAILQHQNQTQQFQTQAPWLNRPITPDDQRQPEIDIQQVETHVEAEITPSSNHTESITP